VARVLVVTPVALEPGELERQIHEHAGEDAQTHVVVPAVKVSRLQWLTNEEDEARADAVGAAERTDAGTGTQTRAEAGDTDPVQAVEDALRTFPADEIVVVTRPDADAEWLEGGTVSESLRRFDVPVTHLVVAGSGGVRGGRPGEGSHAVAGSHELARGADEATPARLLGRVGTIVFSVAAVVIVLAFVIQWLV
jgi:hypothetical protein